MRTERTGSSARFRPEPPVPWYKQPLFALLDKEAFKNANLSQLQEGAQQLSEGMKQELPKSLGWLAPVVSFILKRNPIQLGGVVSIVQGIGYYIISKIGIDRIVKYLGVILGIGGVGAAAIGSIMSVNLKGNNNRADNASGFESQGRRSVQETDEDL